MRLGLAGVWGQGKLPSAVSAVPLAACTPVRQLAARHRRSACSESRSGPAQETAGSHPASNRRLFQQLESESGGELSPQMRDKRPVMAEVAPARRAVVVSEISELTDE